MRTVFLLISNFWSKVNIQDSLINFYVFHEFSINELMHVCFIKETIVLITKYTILLEWLKISVKKFHHIANKKRSNFIALNFETVKFVWIFFQFCLRTWIEKLFHAKCWQFYFWWVVKNCLNIWKVININYFISFYLLPSTVKNWYSL